MPVKGPRGSAHHRSGPTHKRSKHYMQPYWPYIPLLLIVIVGLLFGGAKPVNTKSVLAYSTNVSNSGLLQATNTQRAANGAAALGSNQQLINAAQAKANDMVARNYWSHNTPDGQPPWVFMSNAGYDYSKAGENLAYGFSTSDSTVNGWMNSPGHKANMLDTGFTEVGFGYANSANFVSSGQQTVVVAMYGRPQVLAATTPPPTPPPAAATQTTPPPRAAAPAPAPTPTPTPTAVSETTPTPTPSQQDTPNPTPQPITSEKLITAEPASIPVSRLSATASPKVSPALLFGIGLVCSLAVLVLLLKHGFAIRHLIRNGEHFVLKHPLLDTMLVAIIMAAYVLNATTGYIR